EPRRLLRRDVAQRRRVALLRPDPAEPLLVALHERDEDLLLAGEVVEDRAAREAALLLEPSDRRALVAVARETAPRGLEDLLAAAGAALVSALWDGSSS